MRVAVRTICIVLAAALVLAATLGIVEIVMAALGRSHVLVDAGVWDERLRTTAWEDSENMILAGLVALVGLALLALAWWPRRQAVVGVGDGVEGVDAHAGLGAGSVDAPVAATIRRRDLEAALTRAASRVDTVTSASVSVDDDVIRVSAVTARRQGGDLRDRVQSAVTDSSRRLAVVPRPVKVKVQTSGGPS
jgi:hypothetical protein